MFYILLKKVKNADTDAILEGSFQEMEMEELFNVEGETISGLENIEPIHFNLDIYTVRGKMTDHLYIEGIKNPIFSEKVKDIIEKLNIWNVQFFPLKIIDEYSNLREVQLSEYKDEVVDYKTVNYDNYFICNLEGLVDCINHEESNLEYFSPLMNSLRGNISEEMKTKLESKNNLDIDTILSLKIDETRIPENTAIFRLIDCPRIVIVKEEFVQAINEAELSGFVLIPISNYSEANPDTFYIENKPPSNTDSQSYNEKRQLEQKENDKKKILKVKPDRPPSLMSDLEDDDASLNSDLDKEDTPLLSDSDGRLKRETPKRKKIIIKRVNKNR